MLVTRTLDNDDSTYSNGDGALDDIEPLPSSHASLSIKSLQNSGSDEIAKGTTKQRTRVKHAHSEIELGLCVPSRQVKEDASEERGL